MTFKEVADEVVKNSNGVIQGLERSEPGIFLIQVSNAWYLSSDNEKQYFAEEMLKNLNTVSKNMDNQSAILTIYDESLNEVATTSILGGGMKIKK